MNASEFRKYLTEKRLERQRKEVEAANTPPRDVFNNREAQED